MSRRPVILGSLLAVAVTAAALAGSGFVYAHGNDAQISACVDPFDGHLSITTKCAGTTLTWNTQGPAGALGPAGPPGPAGSLDPTIVNSVDGILAGTQTAVQMLNAAIAGDVTQARKERARFMTLRRRFASATTVSAQLSDLADMSNETSLALQQAMDRHDTFLTTLSNLMKRLADSEKAVTDNLK